MAWNVLATSTMKHWFMTAGVLLVAGCDTSTSEPDQARDGVCAYDPTNGGIRAFPCERGDVTTSAVVTPGGTIDVVHETLHGLHIVEGDMVIGSVDDGASGKGTTDLAPVGNRALWLWPNARVPFVLEGGWSASERSTLDAALAHWHTNTRVRFVPRASEESFVSIVRATEGGCWANVGWRGGRQMVHLGPGCVDFGVIVHELGHAAGLWHEQSRTDRDGFVTIHWGNIIAGEEHNFQTFEGRMEGGENLGPYDTQSVMHYHSTAFSSNGRATITRRDGATIGWNSHLSGSDIRGIEQLYGNRPPTVDGSLDGASCGGIGGWMRDQNALDRPGTVHLYVDGAAGATTSATRVYAVSAGNYREDLCNATGSCYRAFHLPLPPELHDGRSHVVRAYGIDSTGVNNPELPSARSFRCHAPRGHLDVASCSTIAGWAQDQDAPHAAVPVHVYIDSVPGQAGARVIGSTANQYRADLCGALGSCNHAFSTPFPSDLVDGAQHTIRAYGLDLTHAPAKELGTSSRVLACVAPRAADVTPYDQFDGGASVAVCELDGTPGVEIVTGAGKGGGPHVRVFDDGVAQGGGFYAYSSTFKGGVDVACLDVDGDGLDEIATAAGPGGGPHVRVWRRDGTEVFGFMAYDPAFAGGVNVAGGDVDGDGKDEIITGAGTGGGPHVRVWRAGGVELSGFFAYDPSFAGGVDVAAGDLYGTGRAAIVTGAGPGGGPHVRIFALDANHVAHQTGTLWAYATSFTGGVRVAVGDAVADGRPEIVTTPAVEGGPHVRVFDVNGNELRGAMAFEAKMSSGLDPAAGPGVVFVATRRYTGLATRVRRLTF